MIWLRDIRHGLHIRSLLTGREYLIQGCREAEPHPELYLCGADGDHRGDGWVPLVLLQANYELVVPVWEAFV